MILLVVFLIIGVPLAGWYVYLTCSPTSGYARRGR